MTGGVQRADMQAAADEFIAVIEFNVESAEQLVLWLYLNYRWLNAG